MVNSPYVVRTFRFVFLLILLTSCVAGKKLVPGEKKVIDTSEAQPKWVTKSIFAQEGYIYIVNSWMKGTTLETAQEYAKKVAIAKLQDEVALRFKTLYKQALVELNLPEDKAFLIQGQQLIREAILPNVREEDLYYEEYEEETQTGIEDFYNVYFLISIPENDFERAKLEAISNIETEDETHQKILTWMKNMPLPSDY